MHKSVLLEECLTALNLKKNSIIVDCTLGYGGHSGEILRRIPNGRLITFDQDKTAIEYSKKHLDNISKNYVIIKSNFKNITKKLYEINVKEVDGILYDLGVSSPQLDVDERGFSFHNDAKLDMRMDKDQILSAYEVVNTYSKEDLIRIFREYGEEKYAVSIANGIVNKRPIATTLELVQIIKDNVPFKYRNEKHPARKVFQAIRIEVNDELNVIDDSIRQALELIKIGGRIAVITFHSLEDKRVKKIFKEVSELDRALLKLPVVPLEYQPRFKIIGSFSPNQKEIEENNRARSAKLRIIERMR